QQEFDVSLAKQGVAAADKLKAEQAVKRAELDVEYAHITADQDGRISKAEVTEGNLVKSGGSDPLLTTIKYINPIRLYFNVDEATLLEYTRRLGKTGKNPSEALAELKGSQTPFTFALGNDKDFANKGTLTFGDNQVNAGTGTMLVYGTVDNEK